PEPPVSERVALIVVIPPVVVPLQYQSDFPGFPVEDVQIPDPLLQTATLFGRGGFGCLPQGNDPQTDQVAALTVAGGHTQKGHGSTSPARPRKGASSRRSQGTTQSSQRVRPARRQQG